ncbi:hypothetical protein QEN19_002886 [Hanseniaspora menglaensis]
MYICRVSKFCGFSFGLKNRCLYSVQSHSITSVKMNLLRSHHLQDNLNNCEFIFASLKNTKGMISESIQDFKSLYLQKLYSIITPNNQDGSNQKCLTYLTESLKINGKLLEKKDINNLLSQILLRQSNFQNKNTQNGLFLQDIIEYLLILSGDITNIHPQVVCAMLTYFNNQPVTEETLKFSAKIITPILDEQLYLKTPFYISVLIDLLSKQRNLQKLQELLPAITIHLADKEELHLKLFDIFVSLKDETNLKELMPILNPTISKHPRIMSYVVKTSSDPILKLQELQPELENNEDIIQYLIFSRLLIDDLIGNVQNLSANYLEEFLRLLNIHKRFAFDMAMFENDKERFLYSSWNNKVGELMVLLFLKKKMLPECVDFIFQHTDLTSLVTHENAQKLIALIDPELQQSNDYSLKNKFDKTKNVLTKRLNGETLVNRNHNRSFYIRDY